MTEQNKRCIIRKEIKSGKQTIVIEGEAELLGTFPNMGARLLNGKLVGSPIVRRFKIIK